MSEFDIVRDLAKQVLTIHTPTGDMDDSLWDRAQRLVCNVAHICRLPELSTTGLQIDRFCLMVATYFSDTGLAHYLRSKKQGDRVGFSNANDDDLADFSTQVVEEELGACMDEAKIKKINRIITDSNGHFTQRTEAMILSDARNLDDMGVTGILNEFRRFVSQGKSICDALQSWERKIDYRYWQARLKKSFRFESVRKLAEQRLAAAESFMNQLKVETQAQDMEELFTEVVEGK